MERVLKPAFIKATQEEISQLLGKSQAQQQRRLVNPFIYEEPAPFIPCDEWIEEEADKVFRHVKDAIILPVSEFYGITADTELDYFRLDIKQRCYNSNDMRDHMCHYLNYFEKFYDTDKELVSIYYRIKYMMDCEPEAYTQKAFIQDIKKYILGPSIRYKAQNMNHANYNLELTYRNNKNPCLQYNNSHAMMLMEISLLINMIIPLLTHFVKKHQKDIQVKEFLLYVFNIVIAEYSDRTDFYSKLYETVISNVSKNRDNHSPLWDRQAIRAISVPSHSEYTVNNIILQIIPKYTYNQNLVHYNFSSVNKNIKFRITDIGWEFVFISLSNNKRDEDMNSEFDKFETYQTKADEALYVQNKVNAQDTMRYIEQKWGPFDDDEIEYYRSKIGNSATGEVCINSFQMELVFNLFYSYFGDPQSIKAINNVIDYIKLVIAARRMLELNGLIVLPYIISSKVLRLVTRKNINKKEMANIEASPNYPLVLDKYKNEKIKNKILNMIAVIAASEFEIIDFNDTDNLDGQKIHVQTPFIIEEVLLYTLMI